MTLIDIFEHILDGFNFNNDRICNIISKTEDIVCTGIEKTLEKLTF